jgi:glycosyltransferase involved in cell wall biosynthesis
MRGAAVTLAASLEDLGGWQPDVVLVGDMIDLAHFRHFARPHIGDPPVALYFHESQFTYPEQPGEQTDHSYALTNWISALAADGVVFNSEYHREVFFSSLPGFLRQFPDQHHTDRIPVLQGKSDVLPVGVDLSWVDVRKSANSTKRILWNHRWEFDKAPDSFADAVGGLLEAGARFELVLAGPRPPNPPAALQRIRDMAPDHIVYDDEAPRDEYEKLLTDSGIVVSTALQEFFGISIVEAVAAGCHPILPNRLSYPSLIPSEHHDAVLYEDGELTSKLLDALETDTTRRDLADSMQRFSWERIAPLYDEYLENLTAAHRSADMVISP